MRPTPLARRILQYDGIEDVAVAKAEGVELAVVHAERQRQGVDLHDGTPARPALEHTEEDSFQFFDALMRGNRSVCG
jgi:hypothetical protein